MHVGASVLRDLDLDSLADALPTTTIQGRLALLDRLANPVDSEGELQSRQTQIRQMRSLTKSKEVKAKIAELRKTLKDAETDVGSVGAAATDTRHAEYYTQILWPADSTWNWLNKMDLLNEAIVFFRTLFLPGLSIVLPIFVLVAPLLFFTVITKEELTFESYFRLLSDSVKKAMPSVLGKPRFTGQGGVLEFGESFFHIAAGGAMFVASIWNQISAAMSMRAVVADMRGRAQAVVQFSKATADLAATLGQPLEAEIVTWSDGQMGLFGHAWNEPKKIDALLKAAGRLDMLAAIALAKRTCFAERSATSMKLQDLYHPSLAAGKRIYNSVELSAAKKHVLLTGPNRGGKSTLLKSLGAAVLMAQTVGIVFARSAALPLFENVITALSPQDVIGKLSLFEAEIEFAKDVKARLAATKGPTFLMMDEIFHGTNAHDGVEASQVFLDQLYKMEVPVFSVVSTHYMDLPARYGSKEEGSVVQNLCMDTTVDPADGDRLIYSYRVIPGVNKYSSVREILRERGLLTCDDHKDHSNDHRGPIPEKTTKEGSKE